MNRRSAIVGTGGYLPQHVMTNTHLPPELDTSHQWIAERTGIHQRHLSAPGECTSDLAFQAANQALDAAGLGPEDIDLIIVGTSTPDRTFPSTATYLQKKLGMQRGTGFDVAAACSGFIFALATADAYLHQGMSQRALVVGADTLSRLIDWGDRSTAILFGDGAGAVVLQAIPDDGTPCQRGIIRTILHTGGDEEDALKVSGGPGSNQKTGVIEMKGREVFKRAVFALGEVIEEILNAENLTIDDIDWLVPHQANRRIIDATAKRFALPQTKIVQTIERHANTSAASVPLALNEAILDGRIRPGHLVLCEAFGAGYAWGATLIRL